MTTERMTGSELHRVDAAPLAPPEQLRLLTQLAAVLDLEQLIESLPAILRGIAPVTGSNTPVCRSVISSAVATAHAIPLNIA